MFRDIYVDITIEMERSQTEVLPFVQDLKNIEYCEVKADRVDVTRETDRTGTYTVKGRFARYIPWQRTFAYQLHSTGFHSKEAQEPPSMLDIQGGFTVESAGEGRCKVYHYEQYKLPYRFLLLKPLIVAYLKWSQRKEMEDFEKMVLARLEAQQPSNTLSGQFS
jgi:hypothetical protein